MERLASSSGRSSAWMAAAFSAPGLAVCECRSMISVSGVSQDRVSLDKISAAALSADRVSGTRSTVSLVEFVVLLEGIVLIADGVVGAVDGFFRHVAQVGAGGLQGVEDEAGALGVEGTAEQGVGDLHQGQLNGGGVFEQGQCQRVLVGIGGVLFGAQLASDVGEVKETIVASAQGGRTAEVSVAFDVFTVTHE